VPSAISLNRRPLRFSSGLLFRRLLKLRLAIAGSRSRLIRALRLGPEEVREQEQVNGTWLSKTREAGGVISAWGGAKRNPRTRKGQKTERTKRAIAAKLQFTLDKQLLATSWTLPLFPSMILRFRSAPPQGLRFAALRGLNPYSSPT
jgi:hypothetical protein